MKDEMVNIERTSFHNCLLSSDYCLLFMIVMATGAARRLRKHVRGFGTAVNGGLGGFDQQGGSLGPIVHVAILGFILG